MRLPEAVSILAQDRLLPVAAVIFAGFLVLEAWLGRRRGLTLYEGGDTRASIALGLMAVVIELPLKALALVAYTWLHELSPLRDVVGRQAWAWVLLFLADDLTYYSFHRANHEVRLLWAGHVPHHSSVHLNYATALRQGVGERLHKFLWWAWLPLVGFDAVMILTMMAVSLFIQFFVHTQLLDRLPAPLEWLFNTPSHHRVHHASNVAYLDRNHAGVLILWDRLFGTFAAESPGDPPRYGLTKNVSTHDPVELAIHEYSALLADVRRAPRWVDKLRYLLLAPGWSHDGPDLRATTLRRESVNYAG